MTVDTLSRTMSEAELTRWYLYAARKMLPQRRLELHLAQIAMAVEKVLSGVSNVTLADYLFDPPDDTEPTAEEEAAYFDFRPYNAPAKSEG